MFTRVPARNSPFPYFIFSAWVNGAQSRWQRGGLGEPWGRSKWLVGVDQPGWGGAGGCIWCNTEISRWTPPFPWQLPLFIQVLRKQPLLKMNHVGRGRSGQTPGERNEWTPSVQRCCLPGRSVDARKNLSITLEYRTFSLTWHLPPHLLTSPLHLRPSPLPPLGSDAGRREMRDLWGREAGLLSASQLPRWTLWSSCCRSSHCLISFLTNHQLHPPHLFPPPPLYT